MYNSFITRVLSQYYFNWCLWAFNRKFEINHLRSAEDTTSFFF